MFGVPAAQIVVTNSRFVNNTSTPSRAGPPSARRSTRTAATLSVTESTLHRQHGQRRHGRRQGGAFAVTSGTTTLHYNRFAGNTAPTSGSARRRDVNATVDAAENWWGCNAGPGSAGCDTVSGHGHDDPASDAVGESEPGNGDRARMATSTITAALTTDSAGGAVAGTNLTPSTPCR